MFDVLDKLDDAFPHHAFGRNKEGELFVDGQKTGIKWEQLSDLPLDEKVSDIVSQQLFESLKESLLKKKIIREQREEE